MVGAPTPAPTPKCGRLVPRRTQAGIDKLLVSATQPEEKGDEECTAERPARDRTDGRAVPPRVPGEPGDTSPEVSESPSHTDSFGRDPPPGDLDNIKGSGRGETIVGGSR